MKIQDVDEEEDDRYSDTHDPYPLDPMPEWDVDSYEGREYESDPDHRELFSDEERYEQYRLDKRKAFHSKVMVFSSSSYSFPSIFTEIKVIGLFTCSGIQGFIYIPLSGSYPIKDLEEIGYDNKTTREKMTNLTNLCIKKLNETKVISELGTKLMNDKYFIGLIGIFTFHSQGKTVEFVHIVRVFKRWAAAWKSSITFMARESPNGPLVEYQAKVVTFPGDSKAPIPILCRPTPIDTHLY